MDAICLFVYMCVSINVRMCRAMWHSRASTIRIATTGVDSSYYPNHPHSSPPSLSIYELNARPHLYRSLYFFLRRQLGLTAVLEDYYTGRVSG